eukprot:gene6897-30876_t
MPGFAPTRNVLCKGFPQEFMMYFQYVRTSAFDEKPDYAYLRRMFRGLCAKEGWSWDYVYDWTTLKCQRSNNSSASLPATGGAAPAAAAQPGTAQAAGERTDLQQSTAPPTTGDAADPAAAAEARTNRDATSPAIKGEGKQGPDNGKSPSRMRRTLAGKLPPHGCEASVAVLITVVLQPSKPTALVQTRWNLHPAPALSSGW